MERCEILDVEISSVNMTDTLSLINQNIEFVKGNYICVSNVHTTILAYENNLYKTIQNNSYMSLPDGKPLAILAKFKSKLPVSRVTGPDLMEEIFKISDEKSYTHFFYGSTDETLNKLKVELLKKFPNLSIKGMYSPPFREITDLENQAIVNEVNKLNPDFVWVGLGAPKQEIWMYNNKDKINSLMIGVGAGFDYHAGNIKRAPIWMQKLSLEWLYRLLQDPKRLYKRYLITNTKFIFLYGKSIIKDIVK